MAVGGDAHWVAKNGAKVPLAAGVGVDDARSDRPKRYVAGFGVLQVRNPPCTSGSKTSLQWRASPDH